jgi:hypothetical protein
VSLPDCVFSTAGTFFTWCESVICQEILCPFLRPSLTLVLICAIFFFPQARGRPAVLLCDRATYDGKAYLSDEKWNTVLRERRVTEEELRDGRYNAVFHLVTAADGAEAYYTLENNTARSETPEQARELDKRGQRAWLGHPHMYVQKVVV